MAITMYLLQRRGIKSIIVNPTAHKMNGRLSKISFKFSIVTDVIEDSVLSTGDPELD